MTTLQIILLSTAAVFFLLGTFFFVLYSSAKKQGKIAQKVGEKAMKSQKVRASMEKQAANMFEKEPEKVEEIMEKMGANREMRKTVESFSKMHPEERKAVLEAAQQKTAGAANIHLANSKKPKQGTNRNKNKAARNARKNNRKKK